MTAPIPRPVSAARNLSAVLVMAIACEFLWSWFNFSGPYRRLIDLQLAWSGSYAEAPTAILLGLAAVLVAGLAGVVRERLLPPPPAAAVELFVVAILLILSIAMVAKARDLWQQAER